MEKEKLESYNFGTYWAGREKFAIQGEDWRMIIQVDAEAKTEDIFDELMLDYKDCVTECFGGERMDVEDTTIPTQHGAYESVSEDEEEDEEGDEE